MVLFELYHGSAIGNYSRGPALDFVNASTPCGLYPGVLRRILSRIRVALAFKAAVVYIVRAIEANIDWKYT